MSGTGSRPVSATRPAKTETIAGDVRRQALGDPLRPARAVMIAVTLTTTPASASVRITGPVNAPLVVVTGIFTLTFVAP